VPVRPRLTDLIAAQVRATPDAVAVVADGAELSYRRLWHRAETLARRLLREGVGRGDLVVVHLERSARLPVAILGVLLTGAGYVPVDTGTPRTRLEFIAAEVRAPVLITEETFDDEADLAADGAVPLPEGEDTDPAYVMYTSGTTGVPNGVIVPHRALISYLAWCASAYDLRAGSGALVHSPIGFDLTVTTLLAPLTVGQRIILVREADGVRGLLDALTTARDLTIVKLTPTHLRLLGLLLTPAELAGRVRTLVVGGEDLRAEAIELFRGTGTRIVNEYGPTETVVGCCVHEVRDADPRTGRVPIGVPIAGTRIDVVDADLEPVPDGAEGEALISGAGVTDGYLGRPEVTARRFVPDPRSPGRRAYRSGDLVRRRPDGLLEYLGRLDDQMKIRGVRVEPGEIEGVLARHPGVAAAAVVLRGAGAASPIEDPRPVAYLVPAAGPAPDPKELARFCQDRLPDFLCPDAFVTVDALPATPNGKLDRAALAAREAH
jgi:nonribosomal peptide synthetase protein BlmX